MEFHILSKRPIFVSSSKIVEPSDLFQHFSLSSSIEYENYSFSEFRPNETEFLTAYINQEENGKFGECFSPG